MSVRDDPVLYLGGSKTTTGGAVGGGSAITTTRPHKLDGAEHTAAEDTTRLDATVDQHGLLPKLSGDLADTFRGDGSYASILADLRTIAPSQLTANTDNWNPTGLSTADAIKASTDASRNLTGIVAPASWKGLILHNIGAFNLVLKHDVTSTAANRFSLPGSADMTLTPGTGTLLAYDVTSARWRVVGGTGGGGGGSGTFAVAEDGVSVVAAASSLDFRHGLDVTDPGGGPARVAVDESELTHNSLGGLTTGDPHTQYRLEADNHDHSSSGLQGGTIAHSALTGLTTGDPHTQYALDSDLSSYIAKSLVTAKGDVVSASSSGTPAVVSVGANGTVPIADSSQSAGWRWATRPAVIPVGFGGAGTSIQVGQVEYLPDLPAMTITRVTGVCDTGTITWEIKKVSHAGFPASLASITGSAGFAITSGRKAQDSTLTGWSPAISDGDHLEVSVIAVSGSPTSATISLRATRS